MIREKAKKPKEKRETIKEKIKGTGESWKIRMRVDNILEESDDEGLYRIKDVKSKVAPNVSL